MPAFITTKLLVLPQPVSLPRQEEIWMANRSAWRHLKESFILGLILLFPWAEDKEIYSYGTISHKKIHPFCPKALRRVILLWSTYRNCLCPFVQRWPLGSVQSAAMGPTHWENYEFKEMLSFHFSAFFFQIWVFLALFLSKWKYCWEDTVFLFREF